MGSKQAAARVITFRIPKSLEGRLRRAADVANLAFSEIIRMATEEWLERNCPTGDVEHDGGNQMSTSKIEPSTMDEIRRAQINEHMRMANGLINFSGEDGAMGTRHLQAAMVLILQEAVDTFYRSVIDGRESVEVGPRELPGRLEMELRLRLRDNEKALSLALERMFAAEARVKELESK